MHTVGGLFAAAKARLSAAAAAAAAAAARQEREAEERRRTGRARAALAHLSGIWGLTEERPVGRHSKEKIESTGSNYLCTWKLMQGRRERRRQQSGS